MVDNKPSLLDYLKVVLGGPLGYWWVFFTAVIGVISWVTVPEDVIAIHKYWLLIIFAVFSLAIFILILIGFPQQEQLSDSYLKTIEY